MRLVHRPTFPRVKALEAVASVVMRAMASFEPPPSVPAGAGETSPASPG